MPPLSSWLANAFEGDISVSTPSSSKPDMSSTLLELSEQKKLVKQLRVDHEMSQATLKCRERTITELTSQYRDALAQVHTAPEKEAQLRQEVDKVTKERDIALESTEKIRNECRKERETSAKASQRVYQLEVDVYRAKELATAQKTRADEALQSVNSQNEDLEIAHARAEKAIIMLEDQADQLAKSEELANQLKQEKIKVAKLRVESSKEKERADNSEAAANAERARMNKALEDVRSMRQRIASEKLRADEATEALKSGKAEALARARAEAAEIMAETHDAAVEDSKALRAKLNEQNRSMKIAKDKVEELKEELKDASFKATATAKEQIDSVSADATAAIMALKQEHEKEIQEFREKNNNLAKVAIGEAVSAATREATEQHEANLKRELEVQEQKLLKILGEEHEKVHEDVVSEKESELTALRMQLYDIKSTYCPELLNESELLLGKRMKRSMESDNESDSSENENNSDSSDDDIPDLNDENSNNTNKTEQEDPAAKTWVSAVGSFLGVRRAKRQRV